MLIAGELTERIIGMAIEVHRNTGRGLLESVYEQCLCHELRAAGIPCERQVPIPVVYKDLPIGGVRCPHHDRDPQVRRSGDQEGG